MFHLSLNVWIPAYLLIMGLFKDEGLQSPFLAFSHYSIIFCLISRYPTAISATTALLCSTFSTTLSRYQLSPEAFFLWVYGIVLHKRVGKGETTGVLHSRRTGNFIYKVSIRSFYLTCIDFIVLHFVDIQYPVFEDNNMTEWFLRTLHQILCALKESFKTFKQK